MPPRWQRCEKSRRHVRRYDMIAYKVSKHARVLFVGINPHPGSYRRGVPFSNNKMFWYLLNRAGLLEEVESDLKSDKSLKLIYETKFLPKYGLNFVNLVDRPTIDVTKLTEVKSRRASSVRWMPFEPTNPKWFVSSARLLSINFKAAEHAITAGRRTSSAPGCI
jgi:hypothetical protein